MHREECSGRGAQEESTGRSPQGGVHREECTRRSPQGGVHREECSGGSGHESPKAGEVAHLQGTNGDPMDEMRMNTDGASLTRAREI